MRENFADGTEYEGSVGYSRAVRVGNQVFVSGTVAWGDDGSLVVGGAYEQARQAIRNIEAALRRAGASLSDVVRTRVYVTDLAHVEGAGRAHSEAFDAIRPASAMLVIAAIAAPGMVVEIEADAVIDGTDDNP